MRKAAMALAAAATVGLTTVAAPAPAQARHFGHGFGPALAGGLIAGAVIGGLASRAYAYGPGFCYYGGSPPPAPFPAPPWGGFPRTRPPRFWASRRRGVRPAPAS